MPYGLARYGLEVNPYKLSLDPLQNGSARRTKV